MLILILITSLILISCSRVPEPPQDEIGKKVIPVFEVFGYARCQNCPIVKHATDSLKRLYADSISVLEYHLRQLGDTLSPEEISEKTELYGIGTSAPVTIIQGIHKLEGAESDESTQFLKFDTYYKSLRLSVDSIGLYMTIDTTHDSIHITFYADSSDNINTDQNVLFVIIKEDSVFFPLSGAEDSIYHNVVKKLEVLSPNLPQYISFKKEYLDQKTIVGMIQDTGNKKILSVSQRRF